MGSLFSGYGGLDIAVSETLGAQVVWHCENDPAASKVLAHHWPDVPNHGDITQVDWDAVEPVDVLGMGFPCQDVSAAGKRAGLRPGTRSGLWTHGAHAIAKLRPSLVIIENVRGLLHAEAHSDVEPCPWCLGDGEGVPPLRALGAVLGDLAQLGYDARWVCIPASAAGAPHRRLRVFIVATDTSRQGHKGGDPSTLEASTPRRTPPAAVGRAAVGRGGAAPHAHSTARGRGQQGCVTPGQAQGAMRETGRGARRNRGARSTADALHDGRQGRQERHSGQEGGQQAPLRADTDGLAVDWAEYGPAVRRWELELDRSAPSPHEPGSRGNRRLSPHFVEWMMGLPAGHVCAVPGVTRTDALRILGNGVVPQQAALALAQLFSTYREDVA